MDNTDLGAQVTVESSQLAETVLSVTDNATTSIMSKSVSVQTISTMLTETQDSSSQTKTSSSMTHSNFKNDDKGIHFYTGLETYQKFLFVLHTLGIAAFQLNYVYGAVHQLDVFDQFFLIMMKLRRHTANFELSRLFCTTQHEVYNIVFTWIRFMALQWQQISIWPPRDIVRFFCPE